MRNILFIAAILLLSACSKNKEEDTDKIITIAGNGKQGILVDGRPGIEQSLTHPADIAVDGEGNVCLIDQYGSGVAMRMNTAGVVRLLDVERPVSLATDAKGAIYFTSTCNIFKLTPDGQLLNIAGRDALFLYSGDGGPATAAYLKRPGAITVDHLGNVYFVDYGATIRKIGTDGIINTVVGQVGNPGNSGDGGPATAAQIFYPAALAVDASNNLFLSDLNQIRRVSTDGIITTVVGSDYAGYSGDGGAATAARIHGPGGIAFDSKGSMYFADGVNNRIRMVTTGGIVSTVAGNGIGGFNGDGNAAKKTSIWSPIGIAIDKTDNIYIIDVGNIRIRKVIRH